MIDESFNTEAHGGHHDPGSLSAEQHPTAPNLPPLANGQIHHRTPPFAQHYTYPAGGYPQASRAHHAPYPVSQYYYASPMPPHAYGAPPLAGYHHPPPGYHDPAAVPSYYTPGYYGYPPPPQPQQQQQQQQQQHLQHPSQQTSPQFGPPMSDNVGRPPGDAAPMQHYPPPPPLDLHAHHYQQHRNIPIDPAIQLPPVNGGGGPEYPPPPPHHVYGGSYHYGGGLPAPAYPAYPTISLAPSAQMRPSSFTGAEQQQPSSSSRQNPSSPEGGGGSVPAAPAATPVSAGPKKRRQPASSTKKFAGTAAETATAAAVGKAVDDNADSGSAGEGGGDETTTMSATLSKRIRLAEEAGKPRVELACNPCRKRKIRCDSTQPTCETCHRRQIPCEYPSERRYRGPGKKKKLAMLNGELPASTPAKKLKKTAAAPAPTAGSVPDETSGDPAAAPMLPSPPSAPPARNDGLMVPYPSDDLIEEALTPEANNQPHLTAHYGQDDGMASIPDLGGRRTTTKVS